MAFDTSIPPTPTIISIIYDESFLKTTISFNQVARARQYTFTIKKGTTIYYEFIINASPQTVLISQTFDTEKLYWDTYTCSLYATNKNYVSSSTSTDIVMGTFG
jgi:hypothetical protein